jgi:TetR/AcrR family transcriptional regulator, mexJK operon transcriptional repressor
MKTAIPRPRAPRQLSEERERELLDAAHDVFFERGISLATMDEIAERAGVSKPTIYRRYKSKDELFEAVVLAAIKDAVNVLGEIELDRDRPVVSLRKAAQRVRGVMTTPEYIRVLRHAVIERRQPELKQRGRERIVAALTGRLTEFFEYLISVGRMQHEYPQHAASTFLILSGAIARGVYDALGTEEDENRRLEADLKMFLHGCKIK